MGLGVGLALGLVLGLGVASSTVASSTAHLRCRGGDLCRGDAGMRGGLDARKRDGHVLVEQGEQQHEPRLLQEALGLALGSGSALGLGLALGLGSGLGLALG